jgi:hypothetical protein
MSISMFVLSLFVPKSHRTVMESLDGYLHVPLYIKQ